MDAAVITIDTKTYLGRTYDFVFGAENLNWDSNPTYNALFIKGVINHANNVLTTRGYLFLNEVLDMLGIPKISDGQLVGWHVPTGRRYVDVAFSYGTEGGYILHMYVDGVIYDKIA